MALLVLVVPCVAQDGGVVQRPSAVAVHLVDVGTVLQQELTSCQGILSETGEQVSCCTDFLPLTDSLNIE